MTMQQPQFSATNFAPNPHAAVSVCGLFKRFGEKIAVNGLGFIPFVYLIGALVLALPTGIAAITFGVSGQLDRLLWTLGLIGVANGVAVLILGTLLGGSILDKRALRIVAMLDHFAALQK